jgi:hypothetical protein
VFLRWRWTIHHSSRDARRCGSNGVSPTARIAAVAIENRQGAFVLGAGTTFLEDERGARRVVRHDVGAQERQVVLRPQQLYHAAKNAAIAPVVVGAPHVGLEPGDGGRIETAQPRVTRAPQIDPDVDENCAHQDDRDPAAAPAHVSPSIVRSKGSGSTSVSPRRWREAASL